MPGKEIKGRSKIANYRYGGDVDKYEELGRVDAEKALAKTFKKMAKKRKNA
ncbi:MAG: hypothetical protein H8E12_10340 [Rhodobacteraceae bacterium]|nr:hypothetical protein [Paracoccaceae bacterium]